MLNFNQNLRSAFALAALMLFSISGLLAQCAAGTPTVVTVAQPTLSACPGSTVSTSILITGTSQVTVTAPNGTRTVYQRDANYRVSIPAYNVVVGPGTVGTYAVSAASCCSFSNCQPGFATFTVNSTFPITQQPISQAICGNTTRFSVVANPNGGTLSYQWRYNGTNLTNGGNISGATINDLTISNATSANLGSYNCIITSSACPNSFSSNTVTLVANTPLSVTQSTLVPICGNNYEIINVTATGGTANQTSYQWYANGSPIQFATAAQVNFSTPANPTGYYCVVSNTGSCNVVTTTPQTISFSALPTISGPTTVQCGSATLTVTDGASYRWDDLSTGSTFTTTATGTYRVTATGSNGCTATLSRSVTVSHATGLSVAIPTNVCASALVSVTNASNWSAFSWNGNFSNQSTQNYTANGTYQVTANNAAGCSASHTFTISNIVAVGYTITGGGCQATTITASPGFASYSWANIFRIPPRPTVTTQLGTAQVLVLSTGLLAGNVVLYATATQGCAVTNSFPVSLVDTDVATISIAPPPVISCSTPITLTASHQPSFQTMSYVWSDGATTAARTANTAGVYSVTGTSNTGCTYTTSVAVSASAGTAIITQQPTSQTACSGAALSLSVAASNPTGYQWRRNGVNLPGATSSSFNITATQLSDAGSYDVVVNGCTGGITSTAVSVNIVATSITIVASSPFNCSTTQVTLTASGALSYSWAGGVTTANYEITSPGSYAVTGTDTNGCTGTRSIMVTNSCTEWVKYSFNRGDARNDQANIYNGTVTGASLTTDRFGNANMAYNFTAANGKIECGDIGFLNNASRFSFAGWFQKPATSVNREMFGKGNQLRNRVYQDNVIYGYNTCTNSTGYTAPTTASLPAYRGLSQNSWFHYAYVLNNGVIITYINGVEYARTSASVGNTCNTSGIPFMIGANTNSLNESWQGGIDDIFLTELALTAAQIDSLRNLPNPNLCAGFAVSISQPATLTCANAQVTLNASGASSYMWANGPSTASYAVTSAGSYTVVGTGANGCTATASVTVVADNTIATPVITANNNELSTSGGVSYRWLQGGNVIPNATSATYTATQNGTYVVEITGANGCTATSAPFTVTGVGIESLESIGVSIYPNPTNGALFITATTTVESVELFDMLGHSIQLPSADNSQLDITSLTNGMYILKARLTDGRTGFTRIMKH